LQFTTLLLKLSTVGQITGMLKEHIMAKLSWTRKEPRAGARDPHYSPERDLAHCGTELVRATMYALDEKYYEDWFKEFFDAHDLTEQDLVIACEKFSHAFNKVINISDPPKALAEEGFSSLPYPVQLAFYCKLGQVFLSAIWSAIKDVSRPDSDPPVTIEELVEDVCNVANRFGIDGYEPIQTE
jgi:hypothetical protein